MHSFAWLSNPFKRSLEVRCGDDLQRDQCLPETERPAIKKHATIKDPQLTWMHDYIQIGGSMTAFPAMLQITPEQGKMVNDCCAYWESNREQSTVNTQ